MKREPTRTRQHGTRVTVPKTADERIAAVRQITTDGQYAKIDGYTVDQFSASAIVRVYDALNDKNRANYAARNVAQMADIAFRLVNRQS